MWNSMQINDVWKAARENKHPYAIEVVQACTGFVKVFTQYGMPMFFYISGLANSFYNYEKGFATFAISKFNRLMIPFVFAYVFILIPRLYLGQEYQGFCWIEEGDNRYQEWNFFNYYIKAFPTALGKISWLWFLIALFMNSLLNYPLIAFSQRRVQGNPLGRTDLMLVLGCFVLLAVWAVPNALVKDAGWPCLVPQVITLFVMYCFMMAI